jgi:hypothetical protein
MATTITWVIEWMNSKPQEGSLTDVVVTAGWRCNGTDGTYNGTAYGTCTFPPPDGDFTPYDQLTQDQVLQWCWENGVDKVAMEAAVEGQIQTQVNPPVVNLPLPWGTA